MRFYKNSITLFFAVFHTVSALPVGLPWQDPGLTSFYSVALSETLPISVLCTEG